MQMYKFDSQYYYLVFKKYVAANMAISTFRLDKIYGKKVWETKVIDTVGALEVEESPK